MAVESANFIGQLVSSYPAGTEPVSQGDDHLRLIKKTLQNSFPNLNAAMTATWLPFTPVGGIAATNTQAAIAELDTEKAPKADPTFTGTVTVAALTASGTVTLNGITSFAAGTAALPSITRTGDTNTGFYFPAADIVGVTTGGVERFRITGNVFQANYSATPFSGRLKFQTNVLNGDTGVHAIPNGTGTTAGYIAGSGPDPDNSSYLILSSNLSWSGIAATKMGTGTFKALEFFTSDVNRMEIAANGTVSMFGNVAIGGSLTKASGTFRIPHPVVVGKDLVHSFIEGPRVDLIYRGQATLQAGQAVVPLDTTVGMTPGTFVALCREAQCFVTNDTGWAPVKGVVASGVLTISCQDTASADRVNWMVVAERQDQVIKNSDWTDANGKPILEPVSGLRPQPTPYIPL